MDVNSPNPPFGGYNMKTEILKHGTTRSYNVKGCRCELCRKAVMDGRRKAPINKHGTTLSYNKGCRCEMCRKAVTDYRKNAPIYEHGKKWAYDKGCRCELCKKAKTAYWYGHNPHTNRKNKTNSVAQTRICSDCGAEKPFSDFHKNKRMFGGISYYCKRCSKLRGKNSPVQRYNVYEYNAKLRDIEFALSFDQFVSFWDKPCYYCGDAINGIGLDRKDSDRGYTIDNVISCCATCNYAKSKKLTTDQFVAMCKKVAKRFQDQIIAPGGAEETPNQDTGV